MLRNQETRAVSVEAPPATNPPPVPVTLPTSISEPTQDREKIHELEEQIRNLEQDLKMTVLRQRETGASANEALRQLENEMDGYLCNLGVELTVIVCESLSTLKNRKYMLSRNPSLALKQQRPILERNPRHS